MKKNILNVTVMAIFALSLLGSSCKQEEKTEKDYLVGAKKGWVLEKGTFDHTYVMGNGTRVDDMMADGFFLDCEKDDIMTFLENGNETINPGKDICPDNYGYQKEVGTTWSLDGKTLTCQIPFFYNDDDTSFDEEAEKVTIVSISDKELVLRGNWKVEDRPTKEDFAFTLTYKAK